MAVDWQALPPEEAVRFFKAKGFAVGFNWRDVWTEEHAVGFTVAKAMQMDVLEAIRTEVDKAIAEGTSLAEFRRELEPTLVSLGWWGRKVMTDPVTGRLVDAQLGSRRRLAIIYDANLRASLSAGRWERIQRVKADRPWLRYVAVQDRRTRPEHMAWHGIVRPVDDPWWRSHFPPNGWRCRCTVQQMADRDLERRNLKPTPDGAMPDPGAGRIFVDDRTGRADFIPEGIDPGWHHNPGLVDRRAEAEARLRARGALVSVP